MKPIVALFFTLISTALLGQTQEAHHCSSVEYNQQLEGQFPEFKEGRKNFERKVAIEVARKTSARKKRDYSEASEEIYIIPVVVHVVHDNPFGSIGGPSNGNISDEQILSQIEVLNQDFRRTNPDSINTPSMFKSIAADSKIEFCLATRDPDGNETNGITRHYDIKPSFRYGSSTDDARLKAHGYWPSDEYLNIWVTTIAGDVLGWAQFPSDAGLAGLSGNQGPLTSDGIVISHQVFGNNIGTTAFAKNIYRFGRTTTHEVGHWLGLYHIFGSSCASSDYVNDTPDQRYNSIDLEECGVSVVQCTNRIMYENYMDYTKDQCMNLFTIGQKDRMRTAIEVSPRRKALLSSKGCCGSKTEKFLPYTNDFESQDFVQEGWDTIPSKNNLTWELTDQGLNSDQSLFVNNETAIGDTAIITTPIINFSTVEKPTLEFDLASNSSSNDILILQYETTCNENWKEVLRFTGPELNTTSQDISSTLESDDWLHHKSYLEDLALRGIVKFRFLSISEGSRSVYIDNFRLYKSAQQIEVYPFPNPTNDEVTIEIIYDCPQDVTLALYDSQGKKHFEETYFDQRSGFVNLDLRAISPGLYFIKASTSDQSAVVRLTIDTY